MQTQCKVGHQLDQMISPADVMPFVSQNIPALLPQNLAGQVNSGAKNSKNKRRVNLVRQIHIVFQSN